MSEPLLRVVNLEKKFPIQRGLLKRTVGQIHAVDGISFDVVEGETLGLTDEQVAYWLAYDKKVVPAVYLLSGMYN